MVRVSGVGNWESVNASDSHAPPGIRHYSPAQFVDIAHPGRRGKGHDDQTHAHKGAELAGMLAEHAQLKDVRAALQAEPGHEKSSGTLNNNAAELLRFEQSVQQPAERELWTS
jgi:hypothetical protein